MDESERYLAKMKNYFEHLQELYKISSDEAKEEATNSLIRSGIMNKDGSMREQIITDTHLG